ncbi:MAG: DMT family transporter [Pseudomonadota bacterium]
MSAAPTPRQDNVRGSAWLLADIALNIWALTIVKALGLDFPAVQLVFIRAVVGLLLVLPWVALRYDQLRTTDRLPLHLLRVALATLTLTASFFAVARLPFALFTALSFTRPLVLMAMAAVLLGERIPRGRWGAALAGLAGVLIAVGPDPDGWTWGMVALCVTVIGGSATTIVTRTLNGTPPMVMMLFYTGGLALCSAPFALLGWVPVSGSVLLALVAAGVFAQAAQYCFLRAHWLADTGVLGPLSYVSFLATTLVGFFVFSEVPGLETIAGAAVITLAALAVTRF